MADQKTIIYGIFNDGEDPPTLTPRAVRVSNTGEYFGRMVFFDGTALYSTNPYGSYWDFNSQGITDMVPVTSFPLLFAEDDVNDPQNPIFVKPLAATVQNMDPDPTTGAKAGAAITTGPAEWSVTQNAAEDIAAECAQAGVADRRHVVTSIYATIVADATATVVEVNHAIVYLQDEDDTVYWQGRIGDFVGIPSQSNVIALSGLNITLPAGKSAILIFDDGTGTGTFQTVSMTGYSVRQVFVPI